ncbi:hypothetical protein R3P38DRAFT_3246072 [Favolaschia claudopus]|uniref:Uncharacterized protein n=1 Tax=Favolaschia claudopus TaxID=2862362 RepID=A0AAV9YZB8_9AGAR
MVLRRPDGEDHSEPEDEAQSEDDDQAPPRAVTRRVKRQVESEGSSDEVNKIRKITQEIDDAGFPLTWDEDKKYDLEYFDDPLPPTLQDKSVEEGLRSSLMGNASLLRLAPDIQHHAGNLPDERAAPSTAVEAAEGTMTETTAANVPITNPAAANAAAAASAAATATAMDFPKLRKRTKRNLTEELECICGQEVTEQQRQSSALQCTRAGCETIWVWV